MKLTIRTIEATKPGASDIFAWDDALPGFGVRVKSSGRKAFILQYRNAHGLSRRLTLGLYGVLTPEQARNIARQHLAAIAQGADPAAERGAMRRAATVNELADRYLTEHAEAHKKPSSVAEDRRLIAANIKPTLGTTPVAAVSRADIAKLHHAKRGTPFEANRSLALLSKMFSLAELWGLRSDGSNPCGKVKRYKESKRERFYAADELTRLGKTLVEAERTATEMPGVIASIRLLAFTGCRMSEILGATWDAVDMAGGTLRLADAKAGARTVTLATPALAVLADLTRDGANVVHGPDPSKPLSANTLEKAWSRIRDRAKLTDARLHDLRHTVGTFAGQAFNAFLVRDLLGHKTMAMTGRYVSRDADPLRQAADHVAGRIAAAMAGKSADLVKLPTAATGR